MDFESHLTGFDLREIEDVVDDGEQGPAAVASHRGELTLLGRKLGAQEQLGHADDAVHWGADLVAHVGQKPALGAAGQLGSGRHFVGPGGRQSQLLVHLLQDLLPPL